jgi:hypothetical protein
VNGNTFAEYDPPPPPPPAVDAPAPADAPPPPPAPQHSIKTTFPEGGSVHVNVPAVVYVWTFPETMGKFGQLNILPLNSETSDAIYIIKER